jgi:toxin YoeB
MYTLILKPQVEIDIERHKKAGNKQVLDKLLLLFHELILHPTSGTGKPERLKGKWSRRITERHRLIYEIFEDIVVVEVIQTYGHYDYK